MDLIRTAAAVDFFTDMYNQIELAFKVKHGTYTTNFENSFGKQKFLTHRFSNKVFAAANMIKKDVTSSDKGQEIMNSNYKRDNYSNSGLFENLYIPNALNIDINSAYATCLFQNKLITEKTFQYIRTLKKDERLPCVGMLARGHTLFEYAGGVCMGEPLPYREPTAQVFYYLISEINYLMQSIEYEIGPAFIFYWVDGIFIRPDISKKKLRAAEEMILEEGYSFKYEEVKDLRYYKQHEKYVVEMIKNNEPKKYEFADVSGSRQITKNLYDRAKQSRLRVEEKHALADGFRPDFYEPIPYEVFTDNPKKRLDETPLQGDLFGSRPPME